MREPIALTGVCASLFSGRSLISAPFSAHCVLGIRRNFIWFEGSLRTFSLLIFHTVKITIDP